MTKASPPYRNTGTPSFPLFKSLLKEGLSSSGRSYPQCPATAPVLPSRREADRPYPLVTRGGNRSSVTSGTSQRTTMEQIDQDEEKVKDTKDMEDTGGQEKSCSLSPASTHEGIIPITLQSPPKSRLKRQLSIDTVDRSERERICKKIYARHLNVQHSSGQTQWTPYIDPGSDEIDGERSKAEKRVSSQDYSTELTECQSFPEASRKDVPTDCRTFPEGSRKDVPTDCRSFPEASRKDMPLDQFQIDELRKSPQKHRMTVYSETSTSQLIPGVKPQPSPNLFNLNEIGLTSPFNNTTPRAHTHQDVFVFPDPATTRKVSPYKHPVDTIAETNALTDKVKHRTSDERLRPPPRDFYRSESVQREPQLTERRPQYAREESRETDSQPEVHNYPHYLSPKGFIWPKTATITEPLAFSPRVVTADIKPRFPASSSSSSSSSLSTYTDNSKAVYNDSYEENFTRLQTLEREYARAKDVYGCPSKDPIVGSLSPRSRQVNDLILSRCPLRSISDIERSPNEKDIRETGEDVRSKYERSISDPMCNPRQYRNVLQQASPLSRERGRIPTEANPHELLASPERRLDPWQADVRRRLFMKTEQYNVQEQRRPLGMQPQPSVSEGSLDIPDEVLQFLHTRNFHPEDLENLKDILRRGAASPTTSATSGYQRGAASPSSSATSGYQRGATSPTTSATSGYQRGATSPTTSATSGYQRRAVSPSPSAASGYQRTTSIPYESSMDTSSRVRIEDIEQEREMRRRPMLGRYDQQYAKVPIRERRHGEIDVRLTCDSITENTRQTQDILRDLDHDGTDCKCTRIEEEIRRMAMDAYTKIRRADTSVESFYQFQNEVNETNTNVVNSMQILCGIKCLCKYGRTLEEMYTGSVIFRLACPGLGALEDLWQLYRSGHLQTQLQDAFVTDPLLEMFDCAEIRVNVTISFDQYLACKKELDVPYEPTTCALSPIKHPVVHVRSRSEPASVSKQANQLLLPKTNLSPFRERFCSDTAAELSPRKAFAEINARKPPNISPSPSKKHVPDNVFSPDDQSLSPLTSPRRTSFGILPSQLEQENVDRAGAVVTSPRQRVYLEYPWSDNREHRVTDV